MPGKSKPIIVTVSDEALSDIQRIADNLKAKGMNVDRVMSMTGVISGSSPPSRLPALKKISGVASVEEELSAELPPVDSKRQ